MIERVYELLSRHVSLSLLSLPAGDNRNHQSSWPLSRPILLTAHMHPGQLRNTTDRKSSTTGGGE